MKNIIIQQRLKEYNLLTAEQELNALKEIVQEIILYGLSTTDFFEHVLFQGGASLRILYGLQRFSEDLDFILKKPNLNFNWKKYIESINLICEEYGIIANITDKSKTDASMARLFIKPDAIGKLINLSFKHQIKLNLLIKLEIDINPPLGSTGETKFLDFPLLHAVEVQDLASNFAGKSHVLLCRTYIKGGDWYDFMWYVSKKITPNFELLQNAINQIGPWQNKAIRVTKSWYIEELKTKIKSLNWDEIKADVQRFLNEPDRRQLSLWGKELFLDRVEKLHQYVDGE